MQRKNKHNSLQNKLDEAGQKKMQEVNISIYVQMLTPYIYIILKITHVSYCYF